MVDLHLPNHDYHGYSLFAVYGVTTQKCRKEILELWQRNNAIASSYINEDRARQVVYMIRNASDQLVGVSTVYVSNFKRPGNPYFFYRMFIQQGDRVPGLMRFVTLRTRDLLAANHKQGQPHGLLIVTENQKLMRPGMQRMFNRNGFEYLGQGPRGNDIWVSHFNRQASL